MRYRKAIFVVTYAIDKGEVYYLILKRKLHWKGWEFPKGGLEGVKERIFTKRAVKREIIEETGLIPIEIKKHNFSGKFKYNKIFKDRPGLIGQTYQLYSAKVKKKKPNLKKNSDGEHSGFSWVDYKTAIKKLTWLNQKKCLKLVNTWLKNEIQRKNS